MNPYDKAHELARALKASQQYQEAQKAKEIIEQDETNKKILKEWRELQFEAQRCYLLQQELPEEKRKAIENLNQIVAANSSVQEYLHKEMNYAQLIADIQKILAEAMEI